MPRHRSNLIRNLLLLVLLAIVLLMGVSPLIEIFFPVSSSVSKWMEWLRSRVMEGMVALWFFVFGSMVGSFINVVVWRMPRGVSVVSRGSACPYCCAKIKLSDNVPVFGWIKLRGRCRVCRLPISPRYPVVEAIFGFVFLLMFFVELQSAAANLPNQRHIVSSGILQVIVATQWNLILIYVYHMILLVMLMTWSLMAFDGSRMPVKTVVFALEIGLGVPWFFPYVQPVKWMPHPSALFGDLPGLESLGTGVVGLACGLMLGIVLQRLLATCKKRPHDRIGIAIALATVGLFNGWQFSTMVVALFGLLLALRYAITALNRQSAAPRLSSGMPACGLLAMATLFVLCLWKQLHADVAGIPGILRWTIPPVAGLLLSWAVVNAENQTKPEREV